MIGLPPRDTLYAVKPGMGKYKKIKPPARWFNFFGGGTGTRSGKALRAKRDDFAAFQLQNLLIFEPATALQRDSRPDCARKK